MYGYNLQVCETTENSKPKAYIVCNALQYVDVDLEDSGEASIPADIHKVLIMLILTHIFMSSGPVSDGKEITLCYISLLKL